MVATRKHLIWAVFASALLVAPIGYFLGQGLVGSASSAGASDIALEGSAGEMQDPKEIEALEAMDENSITLEDPEGINIVPDAKAPESIVEDCKSHLKRGVQNPEQVDQVFSCKALLLAEEGKIAPGRYTNAEMETLVESQEPNAELQR
jgi:hypothetical protein